MPSLTLRRLIGIGSAAMALAAGAALPLVYATRLPPPAALAALSTVCALHHGAAAIVRTITSLGASLGMTVTAEGVEQQEQFDRLIEARCDEAQGHHLGRPRPARDIDAVLQADRERGLRLVS